jgi:RNA polymerase sigma-70 factor (ECF subfamily)
MPATQEAGIFDESALVAKAREGDLAAFNELVNSYSRKIFRLAKHITQNDEDAEDVLQETFLKAFEHLGDFQGQSKFYTWIVRIAVNESLMKLRKRKSDRSVPLDEPVDTGEDTVVREIAVWDENPDSGRGRPGSAPSFSNRFRTSRHRRTEHRGDCRGLGDLGSRGEKPSATRAVTASREADAFL